MVNKVYINPETAITWTDTGGDEILDLGSLASSAGRVGEQHDWGATARSEWFEYIFNMDGFDTAPVVGEAVELYFAGSDGTNHMGPVAFADAADAALGSVDILPNLIAAKSAIVRSTTAADNLIVGGIVRFPWRYMVPVVYNRTADALLGTADAHKVIVTPIPPELQ